ncbi:MAG: hypothetical protein E6J45_08610 [Chloroflexi bacterium]|nr:MAG: hypothetical protein E6J45_08610 [Chloroflexota bacterium]
MAARPRRASRRLRRVSHGPAARCRPHHIAAVAARLRGFRCFHLHQDAGAATAVTGVLLVTFGSAVTADQVPAYLASVRAGRAVPAELISEFQRRYARIGRSPLIDITAAQAAAMQRALDAYHGANVFSVAVGMLHAAPSIAGAAGAAVLVDHPGRLRTSHRDSARRSPRC